MRQGCSATTSADGPAWPYQPWAHCPTDPLLTDTDHDHLSDSTEVKGFHTRKLNKTYRSNPVRKDTDRDGLADKSEVTGSANKAYGRTPTDPMHWDTDDGGVSDGKGVRMGSDPTRRESWPANPRLQAWQG